MNQDPTAGEFADPYAAPAPVAEPVSDLADAPFHPFQSIWLHPRRTVRQIVARDPNYLVIPLACLGGIGEALDRASLRNAGDNLPLVGVLVAAVIIGPLAGIIGLYIGSFLIGVSGKWLGGDGDREHIRTAMAWASVPAIAAMLVWIPQLALFGGELFTEEMPTLESNPSLLGIFLALSFIEVVLAIWGFVLLCNTVAEVQGYDSAWRGLLNLILAALVVFVPLLVIIFAVVLLVGMV